MNLNLLITIIIIWYSIGLITCIISRWKDGEITLQDLALSLIVSIFGPIVTVALIIMFIIAYGDEIIIWRRKTK